MRTLPLTIGLLIVTSCGVLPGGRLEGTPTEAPADWSFLAFDAHCRLEVRPASPRSTTVGCYAHDGQLFVHSHRWASAPRLFGESWATLAVREPQVRLLHSGRIYELVATPVADADLRDRVLRGRGFDPIPEGIMLFKLEGRG